VERKIVTDLTSFLAVESADYSTPLLKAVELNDWVSMKKLIKVGADLFRPPSVGHSAFMRVLLTTPDRFPDFLNAAQREDGTNPTRLADIALGMHCPVYNDLSCDR
jgi:hypothetical protein